MKVLKRNKREVNFNPSKITKRIKDQSYELKVDYDKLSIKIISQMADGMSTRDIDALIVEGAAMKVVDHPDYSTLASRIFITGLRKDTADCFSDAVRILGDETDVLSIEFKKYVSLNTESLNSIIVQDRDFNHDIFGL